MSDQIPFPYNPDNSDWRVKPRASYPPHPGPYNAPQQPPGYQYPGAMPPQPFPPAQHPPMHQPPAPQPYYAPPPQPPQPGTPNQTYVVVNTSQQVNTGCGPWVWIVPVALVVLILVFVVIPVGGIVGYRIANQTDSRASTPIVGTQHNKVNVPVDVRWVAGYTSHHEKVTVTSVKAVTQQDDPGTKDIVINLETTYIDGDNDYASSSPFTLTDDTGKQCKTDFSTTFPQYTGDLSAGRTVSGAILFQIPPDKHTFLLTFNPVGEREKGPLYSWDIHL